MKNRSYGNFTSAGEYYRHQFKLFQHAMTHIAAASAAALKEYREYRENGDERDVPKKVFPSAGLDALKIENSTYKLDELNKKNYWPESGRYWWRLTLDDGNITEDFYWMQDKVRGYLDKNGHYWFTVYHAPSGTKIEGFSAEPDKIKGYPDTNGNYWFYIQYTECGPIKEWMEEKDRNYVARLRCKENVSKVTMERERCTVEGKQQQELEVAPMKKCSANAMSMWAVSNTLTPLSSNSFVSLNIVSGKVEDELPALSPEELVIARANCNYQAKKENQLSFDKGDELIVLKQQGNWWLCELGGLQGFTPRSCLNIISQTSAVNELSAKTCHQLNY